MFCGVWGRFSPHGKTAAAPCYVRRLAARFSCVLAAGSRPEDRPSVEQPQRLKICNNDVRASAHCGPNEKAPQHLDNARGWA